MFYTVTSPTQVESATNLWQNDFFMALKQGREHDARDVLHRKFGAWFNIETEPKPGVVEFMLTNNADFIEDEASTVMHYIASMGYNILLRSVLESACAMDLDTFPDLLDTVDKRGNTPLMSAVLSSRPDTARLLLEHGADPSLHNKSNETPLLNAIKQQDYTMVELIAQFTPDDHWNQQDNGRSSVLLLAAENMHNRLKNYKNSMCEQFEMFRRTCNPTELIEAMKQKVCFAEEKYNDVEKILNLVLQRHLIANTDHQYLTPVRVACKNGDMETLEAMLLTRTSMTLSWHIRNE